MENSKTFTKIRKWASENGFDVIDKNYGNPFIKVLINKSLYFELEMRESTSYRSGRSGAWKGNPKWLYMATNGRYGLLQHSQQYAIDSMEDKIKNLLTTDR